MRACAGLNSIISLSRLLIDRIDGRFLAAVSMILETVQTEGIAELSYLIGDKATLADIKIKLPQVPVTDLAVVLGKLGAATTLKRLGPAAKIGHHRLGNQLHRRPDAERQDQKIVQIAEDRNEVGNEVDRAERVGRHQGREQPAKAGGEQPREAGAER